MCVWGGGGTAKKGVTLSGVIGGGKAWVHERNGRPTHAGPSRLLTFQHPSRGWNRPHAPYFVPTEKQTSR